MSATDAIAELNAMSTVAQALEPLDDLARRRVMGWVNARFLGGSVAPTPPPGTETRTAANANTAGGSGGKAISDFGDIAEYYHACAPSSDADKALVVSSWFQVGESLEGIDTQRVNSALKHLGYGIGNATRAFDQLTAQRPALVIQLRKAGTTKQARKTFRVTDAGLKRVNQLLVSAGAETA